MTEGSTHANVPYSVEPSVNDAFTNDSPTSISPAVGNTTSVISFGLTVNVPFTGVIS